MKFNIGDKVRLDIKSRECLSSFETGDICEIFEIDTRDSMNKSYHICRYDGYTGWAREDELELAEMKITIHSTGISISDDHTVDALRYAVNKMQEPVEYDAKCLGIYNKGEKYMKILEIYERRRREEICKETENLMEEIKEQDTIQKIIQDTENQINIMLDRDEEHRILLNNKNLFDAETEEKMKQVRDESNKKINQLEELLIEIKAQLEITENYDQKLCILVRYGVLNEQWKIDDGKEEEKKSVKRKVK